MINSNVIQAGTAKKHPIGVTLIELMVAVTILSLTFGGIYIVARATFVNAAFHDAEIGAQEDARRAVQFMVTELREAMGSSLAGQTLPNDMLTFRIPEDADGNGIPLNQSGYLETIGTVMYTRDWNDMNGDGIGARQLIRVYQSGSSVGTAPVVTVLANDIMPNEDANWNGILDAGEDVNGSRILERGIWFDRTGSLLRVTVDTQKTAGAGARVWASITADVHPRN